VGVTDTDPIDEGLVPPTLVAVTLKVMATPGVKLGTVHEVLGAATVQLSPPGLAVTV
jgi:hypothetical protein